MQKFFRKMSLSLVVLVGCLSLLSSSGIDNSAAPVPRFIDCYVSPKVLEFSDGPLNPASLPIDVNVDGTWGAWVSPSWIRINGQGTLSSGGDATVTVTLYPPIPAGTAIPGSCATEAIAYVNFYFGCGGTQQVKVRYVRCPCC